MAKEKTPWPLRQRSGRRGLFSIIILICSIVLLPILASSSTDANPTETPDQIEADEIKVAFIHQLTRFIHWPRQAIQKEKDRFVITVIGDSVMAARMMLLEKEQRQVKGIPIKVHSIIDPTVIPDSSILFIGTDAEEHLESILLSLADHPTLVVGDSPGMAARGAAVNFYLQRNRIRFEINPDTLHRIGFAAEAQLYDVAKIIQ